MCDQQSKPAASQGHAPLCLRWHQSAKRMSLRLRPHKASLRDPSFCRLRPPLKRRALAATQQTAPSSDCSWPLLISHRHGARTAQKRSRGKAYARTLVLRCLYTLYQCMQYCSRSGADSAQQTTTAMRPQRQAAVAAKTSPRHLQRLPSRKRRGNLLVGRTCPQQRCQRSGAAVRRRPAVCGGDRAAETRLSPKRKTMRWWVPTT